MSGNRRHFCRPLLVALLPIFGLAGNAARTHAQDAANWLTGRALDTTLRQPVGVGWPDNPLGESLRRLAESQRVAVFLDRRVDPQRLVKLQVNAPLQEVFETIVAEHNTQHAHADVWPLPAERLAVTRLGDVIVIGPSATNALLRTIAENRRLEVAKLPTTTRPNWLRTHPLSWPAGSTPRDILQAWAKTASIRVTNLNDMPHDVWAAAELPAMNSIDALTLLLSNFDMTFRISGNGAQIQLDSIGDGDRVIEKLYSGGADPQGLANDIAAALPEAKIEMRGQQLVINARVEEHEWISGERDRTDSPVAGTQVHTLKVENQPVGELIEYLAESLKFQARWDDKAIADAGISRDTLVSFEVVKQPLDKLLEAVLSPAGLAHQREGDIVRISPKK